MRTARPIPGYFQKLMIIACMYLFYPAALNAQNTSFDGDSLSIGGSNSVAIGFQVLKTNANMGNTGIGYQALTVNTNGFFNAALGFKALYSNTAGQQNTAIGIQALYANINGFQNTATGASALFLNTSGYYNTATGVNSLLNNTTGAFNTANGMQVMHANTTGSKNAAVGGLSLNSNTTGMANAAFGHMALYFNVSGSHNIGIGDSSGYNSVGDNNIFLGRRTGFYETGSDKLYIGNDSNKTSIYADMSTGQVLMGNMKPAGYNFKGTRTLNVLGGILTDSIHVAYSNGWSDHVFADDYTLRPLNDLNDFINSHKHLPNIPSAKEVQTNGFNVADMDSKLLEKIEELTLYILQQQKQLSEQQKQISELSRLVGKGQ